MTRPLPGEPVAPVGFDLCGPLPGKGITVLEASAGTGKTFTIAALTARMVAEGTPLSQILVVTFTRMATGELRDRVRARLVSAEAGLGQLLDSGCLPSGNDDVLRLLADGSGDEISERRANLAEALAVFDAATIATIHGYCQLVLAGLGVAGSIATGADLMEEPRDVIEEVVDDLYVRKALGWGLPPFGRRVALEVAHAAVGSPETALVPPPGESTPGLRRRLADAVRAEVARRLLDANRLTYDDLLVRLRRTLVDESRGPVACERLRRRYSVVLVDEFQDTDPVQWDVFSSAFGTGDTTLVLIGDPKQAIYAFRGADVYAYLDASAKAKERITLGFNWRSDAALLTAFDSLMEPLKLGDPGIPYRRVTATPSHQEPGLLGAAPGALRVRLVPSDDRRLRLTAQTRAVQKDSAIDFVVSDLAADVVRLLESGAVILHRADDGAERSRREVTPGDIAVLVRMNRHASQVQEALRTAGVPAVVAGTESVFQAPAARSWLRLLEALEQPASRSRAVAVAMTPLLGWGADEVAAADDARWEEIHTKLHRWGEVLRRQGVAALFRTVVTAQGVPGRLLRLVEGERELTDLAHVAQLLHAEASASQLGVHALRAWLQRRMDDATPDGTEAEEQSRRLDSDADAVQVLTVHRAKGLEFPIVYCPFLWEAPRSPGEGRSVVFHDADNMRVLDVGGSEQAGNADYPEHFRAYMDEARGEDLRHLYVALTRAKHQAVIWWVKAHECQHSPLGRLVLSRDAEGNVPARGGRAPKDREMQERFEEIAAASSGTISVERASGSEGRLWHGRAPEAVTDLAVASFDRSLDAMWRRVSYSSITAEVHASLVGSEPEEAGLDDEPETAGPTGAPGAGAGLRQAAAAAGVVGSGGATGPEMELRAHPCLLADMPGGTEVGTSVHRVLAALDFATRDLEGELATGLSLEQARYSTHLGDLTAVGRGLAAAIRTPLGLLVGDLTLADIELGDRLDEVSFELPLAGGDHPVGEIGVPSVAALFEAYESEGAPLEGYSGLINAAPLATNLRGYLTGSIDLVFRRRPGGSGGRGGEGGGGPEKYFVVDYKTNWLGRDEQPLTAWHYRPDALDAEMQRLHYPLQAVLYYVALHRYLRWRVPGYDPDSNLGGVLYLFLRGMLGPDAPVLGGSPCGVFSWRPPTGLVTALSDLLDVGSPQAGGSGRRAGAGTR